MGMKISEIKESKSGMELRSTKPAEESADMFARLLAEESGKIGESTGATKSCAELAAVPPLVDIKLSGVQNDFSDKYHQAALAIEGTIDRLEKLQSALQDPKGGLKNIAAAVDNLSIGAGELQQSVATLPANHLLRQMADELNVLAHVEEVKFKRGDYL
jgi:hypothetical protein